MNSSGDSEETDTLPALPTKPIKENNSNYVEEDCKASSSLIDSSPLLWGDFYDRKEQIQIDDEDVFNVYFKGSTGPLFYLIHGGGYSALTWSCFVQELQSKVECQIMAPDLRGHGESQVKDPDNLSVEKQTTDLYKIFNKVYENFTKPPSVLIVGHSMGGALAVHLTSKYKMPNLLALAVIDVVEGSAMEALGFMRGYLRNRPQQFESLDRAISWCISSGTTHNKKAARISMPGQLKENQTGQMRGQFQTEVLAKTGHAVQEDSPQELAQIFANLIRRHNILLEKIRPK